MSVERPTPSKPNASFEEVEYQLAVNLARRSDIKQYLCEKGISSAPRLKDTSETLDQNELAEEESNTQSSMIYQQVELVPDVNAIYAFGGV